MISIIISSCLNKPERKEYLKDVLIEFKRIIPYAEILVAFDKYGEKMECVDKSIVHNNGLGYSWNWGIKEAKNDFILQTEDDWILKFDGDCENKECNNSESFLDILKKRINVVEKYGGIYKFDNMDVDWWKAGNSETDCDGYKFFELNKPIKYVHNNLSMYYYSNHPHLKSKKLHEKIGYYLEGMAPHFVEEEMCKRYYFSGEKIFFSKYKVFEHLGHVSARDK